MPAHDTVHIEVIAHDDGDHATVLYASAIGTTIVSHIARGLSRDACETMLHDLEVAQARGDNPDDVAAAWAVMAELEETT